MNNLLFLIVIISIVKSNKIILIPFKTISPKKLTHENFMLELIDNKIYIELKIGTPYQTIQTLLKLKSHN